MTSTRDIIAKNLEILAAAVRSGLLADKVADRLSKIKEKVSQLENIEAISDLDAESQILSGDVHKGDNASIFWSDGVNENLPVLKNHRCVCGVCQQCRQHYFNK
jgi:hypothetical protein